MTLLCPLNPAMAATDPPPVMEARRWIADLSFPASRPLINVSQAAPVDLPPLALRQAINARPPMTVNTMSATPATRRTPR